MARKRILQVVYSLGVGGSEMVARDIALGLTQLGWENAVCALEQDGALRHELENAHIKTFVSGRTGGVWKTMLEVFRIIRTVKPDIVHTHHLYELFYAWPGAVVSGAKIIHTEHERFSLEPIHKRVMLRVLAALCSMVTVVNEDVENFLLTKVRIPKKRIALIRNGVDVKRISNAEEVRESLGLDADKPVVGIVARLESEKDHHMLLRAFALVVAAVPDAQLLVIGEGSLRRGLESLAESLGIQDNVHFLGVRRDIPELMKSLDVAVLSSKAEGLPLCILEAMAAGKPVVATRVGGIPDVVRDGHTGLLVQPGSETDMARAIITLLTDDSLRERYGLEGQQTVTKDYNASRALDRYIGLYADGNSKSRVM
ncbi:glycosyltransferase [Fundidesulfovibrio terrae]|uniref:glycosyltransferase n=1 Tax=Fundidesulfovibrio terrae TaxID=2922866 RepID=UPI001FB00C4E